MHGNGKFTNREGKTRKGIWKNGKRQRWVREKGAKDNADKTKDQGEKAEDEKIDENQPEIEKSQPDEVKQ